MFDFGGFGSFVSGLVTIVTVVQLGLIILLVMVLFDLRVFLREGTSLMRRTDRFLTQKELSD